MAPRTAGDRIAVQPEPGRRAPVSAAIALLLALFAAIIVQAPYLRLRHAFDDYYFWYLLGMWRTGRLSVWGWLLHPMSGRHLIPSWHATYGAQWACFGFDPLPWHAMGLAVHWVAAVSLFVLARRHLGEALGPATVAVLWSGAAIGGWDNPHAWLATGCLAYGWTCLLVALACTTRAASSTWAALGMLLFLWLALSYWGALCIVAWCVPLHFWLYERGACSARRTRLLITLAAVPILLGAAAVAVLVFFSGAGPVADPTSPPIAWWSPLARTAGQFAAALATLTAWGTSPPAEESWPAKALLACLVFGFALVSAGSRRHWLFFMLFPCVLYLLLVNWSRRDVSLDAALTWGRYLYVPTLAWCVVTGTMVAGLEGRLGRQGRVVLGVCALLACAGFVAHQRQIAVVARDTLEVLAASQWQLEDAQHALLEECLSVDSRATSGTTPVTTPGALPRVVDLPVRLPYVQGVLCPLSVWRALFEPNTQTSPRIVRWDELSEADAEAWLAMLNHSTSPMAEKWRQVTADCRAVQQQLQWLAHEAKIHKQIAFLPEVTLELAGTQVPLSQWLTTMTRDTSAWLRVPASSTMTSPERFADTQRLMQNASAPEALEWQRWFEAMEQGRPVRGLFVR